MYIGFVPKTDDDTVMGVDTPGLPRTLIEVRATLLVELKYLICFLTVRLISF